MTIRPSHWPQPEGRVFTCTRCAVVWEVVELPVQFIDPALFVCGQCPDHQQLDFGTTEPDVDLPPPVLELRYQPQMAAIPFGRTPAEHAATEPPVDLAPLLEEPT